MPWDVIKDSRCSESKPFGVVKRTDGEPRSQTGELEGCHVSREAAKQQLAALYASESKVLGKAVSRYGHLDVGDTMILGFEPDMEVSLEVPGTKALVVDVPVTREELGIILGWKGGPGSGWFGPPRGTHGPGSQGGAREYRGATIRIKGDKVAQTMKDTLQHLNLPQEHTDGLTFTDEPGDDFEEYELQSNRMMLFDTHAMEYASGVYFHPAQTILMPSGSLGHPSGTRTLAHEIGHRVYRSLHTSQQIALNRAFKSILHNRRAGDDYLWGLRDYSFSGEREFFADAYMVSQFVS